MSDNQIPGDERVTPAPQPEETVGQFVDDVMDHRAQAERLTQGNIAPPRRQPANTNDPLGDVINTAFAGDPEDLDVSGLSPNQAFFAGAISSWRQGLARMDQTGILPVDMANSATEGVMRAGMELGNLPIDIANAMGADVERLSVDFDPESEEASLVNDLTTGVSQFLTYFIPVGGALRGVAKGASSRMGLGGVQVGRNRNGAAKAVEYALSAVGGGMIADFVGFDPADGGLSSMIRNTEWAKDNPEIDGLLSMLDSREYVNEDDPAGYLKGRFALAIEGAGLGLVADFGLKQLGQRALSAHRRSEDVRAGDERVGARRRRERGRRGVDPSVDHEKGKLRVCLPQRTEPRQRVGLEGLPSDPRVDGEHVDEVDQAAAHQPRHRLDRRGRRQADAGAAAERSDRRRQRRRALLSRRAQHLGGRGSTLRHRLDLKGDPIGACRGPTPPR